MDSTSSATGTSAADRVQAAALNAVTSGLPMDAASVALLNAAFDVEVQLVKPGRLEIRRGALKEGDRLAVEDGLRSVTVHICTLAAAAKQPLMAYDGGGNSKNPAGGVAPSGGKPALEVLLELILWFSEAVLVDGRGSLVRMFETPPEYLWCQLLEDMMDLGTIDDCRALFQYTQQRSRTLKSVMKQGVLQLVNQLGMLRLCNQLVKRLSKARDVSLCGAILMFIARLYPTSDKSGLNQHGATNTALPLSLDEVAPGALDSSGEPIDAKLYATFWGLQPIFQDPSRIYTPGTWSKASADIAAVLQHFERCHVTVSATSIGHGNNHDGVQAMDMASGAVTGDEQHQQAVSYLTSSKLFGLQMRDATFRRVFLVQCLVLCHALQQPGKGEKVLVAAAKPPPDAVGALVNKLYAELHRTPECGIEFSAAVRHVLGREDSWVAWKLQGCQPFDERPAALNNTQLAAAIEVASSSGAADVSFAPPAKRRRQAVPSAMSSRVLPGSTPYPRPPRPKGLVVQPENNMAGLTDKTRHQPKLREYVDPFIEEMLNVEPGDTDGEREKLKHTNKVLDWRAKRMLSRKVLETYASFDEDIELAISSYYPDVKAVLQKRAEAEKAAAAAEAAAAAAAATAASSAAAASKLSDVQDAIKAEVAPAKLSDVQDAIKAEDTPAKPEQEEPVAAEAAGITQDAVAADTADMAVAAADVAVPAADVAVAAAADVAVAAAADVAVAAAVDVTVAAAADVAVPAADVAAADADVAQDVAVAAGDPAADVVMETAEVLTVKEDEIAGEGVGGTAGEVEQAGPMETDGDVEVPE